MGRLENTTPAETVLNGMQTSVCLSMYVCTYVCMYICMYVRTYVCMYTCTYVCTYVCIYVRTYVYMYVRTYVHSELGLTQQKKSSINLSSNPFPRPSLSLFSRRKKVFNPLFSEWTLSWPPLTNPDSQGNGKLDVGTSNPNNNAGDDSKSEVAVV